MRSLSTRGTVAATGQPGRSMWRRPPAVAPTGALPNPELPGPPHRPQEGRGSPATPAGGTRSGRGATPQGPAHPDVDDGRRPSPRAPGPPAPGSPGRGPLPPGSRSPRSGEPSPQSQAQAQRAHSAARVHDGAVDPPTCGAGPNLAAAMMPRWGRHLRASRGWRQDDRRPDGRSTAVWHDPAAALRTPATDGPARSPKHRKGSWFPCVPSRPPCAGPPHTRNVRRSADIVKGLANSATAQKQTRPL